jgi:anti-sigma regulatory factor (Ser/Thr protein kinase)
VKETKENLKIVLRDQGEPFDPENVPEPDLTSALEHRKERGLGIFFMQKLMDEVIFEFSEKRGNKLTLVKNKR